MKKIGIMLLCLITALSIAACGAQQTPSQSQPEAPQSTPTAQPEGEASGRVLVAYFSNTGNTEAVAKLIAESAGADIFKIEAATPYTADDLDSKAEGSRVNKEQSDDAARPEVAKGLENAADYDVIFIGYPIWLGQSPKVVNTFLESADLAGKTIVPFCTSGSSDITDSLASLKASATGANWLEGRRFAADATNDDVKSWLDGLGLELTMNSAA